MFIGHWLLWNVYWDGLYCGIMRKDLLDGFRGMFWTQVRGFEFDPI